MITVIVTEKGGVQQKIECAEQIVGIGRVQGNQVMLPMGNVSKRHAKLEVTNTQVLITDLNSTNGTYINGRRISEPTMIHGSDKIYIGDFIIGLEGHAALQKVDKSVPAPATGAGPAAPKPPRAVKPGAESVPKPKPASGTRRVRPPSLPRPSVPKPKFEAPNEAIPAGREPLSSDSVVSAVQDMVQTQQDADGEVLEPSIPDPDAAPSPPRTSRASLKGATDAMARIVNNLIDQVARQVKRVTKDAVPFRLDSGTAGTVRIAIQELVDKSVSRGKLPAAIDPDLLRAKAFRAIVDLGPLAEWLEDAKVQMIRVSNARAVELLHNGKWVTSPTEFESEEDLAEVIRCLSAGLESRNGVLAQLGRFRTEEGYLVLTALPPVAASGPVLMIDKSLALPQGQDKSGLSSLDAKAKEILQDAIDAKARLAIIGSNSAMCTAMFTRLIQALPLSDFVVAVEDLPLLNIYGPGRIRLCPRGTGAAENGLAMAELIDRALEIESQWLALSATSSRWLPSVFSAAASRLGVVAQLPLRGVTGPLDRELMAAFAAAKVPISPAGAGTLLESAFDILVVVEKGEDNAPEIKKILSCVASDKGQWSPRTLYGD